MDLVISYSFQMCVINSRRETYHLSYFLRTHANVRTNYTNSTKSIHSHHKEGNTKHAVTFITW
jgi:hypothetical protein